MQRRRFLRETAATVAALTTASLRRAHGANDRLRLALIGCGGRGRSVAQHMLAVGGVEYAAVCDVYEPNARNAKRALEGRRRVYGDFRRVLDLKDVDAVLIATPDHWHAIPAVLACRARKHVYLEKPLAHNVEEGKAIVEAARQSGVVFLTGTQQRSAPHIQEAAEIVQSGKLGGVHQVRVWNFANRMPDGIGAEPDSPAPAGLDWDFYLGPAPWVPFNRKRFLHTYRAFSDYAGGLVTDFGVHRFDSVHQIMSVDTPRSVTATGGRFALGGMGDHPDVLLVSYHYGSFVLTYETTSLNSFGAFGRITPERRYYGARGEENRPNGMAFYGSRGTLIVDRAGYELVPEPDRGASLSRAHRNAEDASALHARHFVRCLRGDETSRADAVVGHRSTTVAHLGNIAYRTGAKLAWDGSAGDFVGAPDASKLLGRKARKPWDLISV